MDSTERSTLSTSRPRERVEAGACSAANRGRGTQEDEHMPLALPETIKMETNITVCAARGQSCGRRWSFPAGEPHTRGASSTRRLTAGVTPKPPAGREQLELSYSPVPVVLHLCTTHRRSPAEVRCGLASTSPSRRLIPVAGNYGMDNPSRRCFKNKPYIWLWKASFP